MSSKVTPLNKLQQSSQGNGFQYVRVVDDPEMELSMLESAMQAVIDMIIPHHDLSLVDRSDMSALLGYLNDRKKEVVEACLKQREAKGMDMVAGTKGEARHV